MNPDRLLALYDKVSEAPDAIARLRRFVLDLAVRGKLVAQDLIDEPASELLKRIAADKARLVKGRQIRDSQVQSIGLVDHPIPFLTIGLGQHSARSVTGVPAQLRRDQILGCMAVALLG